ncbi:hypothetical protein GCM10007417_04680 [Glycocaulis alkaliphilus]|nr:hypothetical protein GCM10007417_04680 [Glycocaulis alkaliphilus]
MRGDFLMQGEAEGFARRYRAAVADKARLDHWPAGALRSRQSGRQEKGGQASGKKGTQQGSLPTFIFRCSPTDIAAIPVSNEGG